MIQSKLRQVAHSLADSLAQARQRGTYSDYPFKHVVIDNAIPQSLLSRAIRYFPEQSSGDWDYQSDVGLEVKYRSKWASEFDAPDGIVDVVRILNSAPMLRALSEVFNIKRIMPDPYFSGGGLNVMETGGLLDVHVDGNFHDASGMHRRLNGILYLTPDWQSEWGGALGMYDETGTRLVKEVEPVCNRLVFFDTHDRSYHGVPNEITCPADQPRRSLILYYYTVDPRPREVVTVAEPHSALWRSRNFLDKKGSKTRGNFE